MVELGPTTCRYDVIDGVSKLVEVTGFPCSGNVDTVWGQYGPREPITTSAGTTSAFHSGVDIGAWYGTPVCASAPGEVVFSGYDGALAQVVVIRHDDATGSVYVHMDGWMAPVGKRVARGEVIGYVGSTGMSTGPHLHYMRVKTVPVPYPTQYYWYDPSEIMDPFGAESHHIPVLSPEYENEPAVKDILIGAWPAAHSASRMLAVSDCTAAEIVAEATAVGVSLLSVWAYLGGWVGYTVGAPDAVNAAFPAISNGTALYVRSV